MPSINDYQKAQHAGFVKDVSIRAGGPGSGRYPAGSGGSNTLSKSDKARVERL